MAIDRTPVKGLYLCGAVAHTGGGVTGIPGHNDAREMLRDGMQGVRGPNIRQRARCRHGTTEEKYQLQTTRGFVAVAAA